VAGVGDALFWHLLLTAELPPSKAARVAQDARSGADAMAAVLGHPSLSGEARDRVRRADLRPFERLMAEGMLALGPREFPDTLAGDEPGRGWPALFMLGDPAALAGPKLAIVGTRAASTYGKAAAYKFAERLALAGVTIVSGGALGVDAAAHEGALAAGGRTVAVFAGGLDQIYPRRHAGLFLRIRDRGALISQFAAGTRALGPRFVQRNALIAGLAHATLVVEAPAASGSLATAGAAADRGRQVFVVPGPIGSAGFQGSHHLIRQGATLVDHPDQVLDDMGWEGCRVPAPDPRQSLTQAQSRILAALDVHPAPADLVAERLGMDAGALMADLTILEMEGWVIRDGIGFARRP
jgi:DNA processing protein